jgi:hypothetical protein
LIGSKPCGQGGSFVAWLSLTTDIRVPQITDDIGARGRWAEVGHLRTFT